MKNQFVAIVVASIAAQASYADDVILDPIVFGAGKEQVSSDVPQSVTTVGQEELDEIQAGAIGDVLNAVPGVSGVGSGSMFGQSFNIRGVGTGLGSAETSIYQVLDGEVKYYESYRQGSVFVETDLLKSVEVLRGPGASTLYSSGAQGGGIVMETKDAADFLEGEDTFAFRQKLGYESNPDTLLSTSILAFRPDEQLDLLAALTYRDIGTSYDGDDNQLVQNNAQVFTGLLKAEYAIDGASRIAFSFERLNSDGNDQDFDQVSAGSGYGDITTIDDTAKLTYGYNPQDNSLIDLTATLSMVKTEKNVQAGSDPETSVSSSFIGRRFYESKKIKLENTADFNADGSNVLIAGLAYSSTDRFADPVSSSHPQAVTDKLELYALNQREVTDRLSVNLGVRAEWQEVTPDASTGATEVSETSGFEPQIAAIYELNDRWNVFGSVARVNRLPAADEMYDSYVQPDYANGYFDYTTYSYVFPTLYGPGAYNPDLKPEKGFNIELGASFSGFDVFAANDQLTFKATAFQNKIKDRIERTRSSAPDPAFDNIDNVTIRGFEFESDYRYKDFFASLNLTYIQGTDDATDLTLDSLQNNNAQLTLGYDFSDQFSAQIEGVFAADREKSDGQIAEGYQVANLRAAYRPQSGPLQGAEVLFSVENIFDATYRPATYYALNETGRNVKLSLAKTF